MLPEEKVAKMKQIIANLEAKKRQQQQKHEALEQEQELLSEKWNTGKEKAAKIVDQLIKAIHDKRKAEKEAPEVLPPRQAREVMFIGGKMLKNRAIKMSTRKKTAKNWTMKNPCSGCGSGTKTYTRQRLTF